MANVFLSYKREDQDRVKPIVDSLLADGLSVWWDNDIDAGAAWRRTIEAELEAADCVIVVWSRVSVSHAGEFVQDEAGVAKAKGTYLPVRIDPVPPPLGFRQVQTIDLEAWTGRRREAAYQTLLKAIQSLIEQASGPTEPRAAIEASTDAANAMIRPKLAVLAFDHPAGDDDQAAFAEALAEDLIAGLSRSRLLAVTPRQSSLTYSAVNKTTPQVCADLGVDYVVQGRIRRMGQRLRISADLVSGADNRSVWSAKHERPTQDQFDLLDEMALAIVGAIEPAVLEQEQSMVLRRGSRQPGHWELFVQGRRLFWRSNFRDMREAQRLLTLALELEPDDSQTLALLAHCHMFYVWADVAKDLHAAIVIAHGYGIRAVSSDPADAFAHFTLGTALEMLRRNDEARAEFERALELNPYHAAAAGMMGRLEAFAGNLKAALDWSNRAIGMSPNDPHLFLWYCNKAAAGFAAEDYDLAIEFALDAVASAPFVFPNQFILAASYAAAGRLDAAKRAYQAGHKIKQHYAIDAMRLCFPFDRGVDADRFEHGLRAAGWVGEAAVVG